MHDQPVDIIHRSPGITAIYNELKTSTRNNVLDLGSASAASFQFFSRLSCHIHFEGLDTFLEECGEAWVSGEALRAGLDDYLSTFADDKPFDVILAWDILNYVDRETLQWLIARLNQYSRANTLLHTVKYMGRNLPATPRHFQILDQYQVRMRCAGVLCSRPFPVMDTATTLKSLRDYTMEYSYTQQEGMAQDVTEQVLRYQPDGGSSKRQAASAELGVLPQATVQHRSYGLEQVCDFLRNTNNSSVLDLGGKAARNGDFFLGCAENFYAEDLLPALLNASAERGEPLIRQHALRYDSNITFDVILAWDLFNFCSREQLAAIYEKLRPHMHSDTKIFTLFYTGAEVPEKPQRCYVLDDKHIALLPAPKHATSKSAAPDGELTAVALLKIFHEFSLARTYIVQPGMQRGIYEYIFQSK